MDTEDGVVDSPQSEADLADVSADDLREALGGNEPEHEGEQLPEGDESPEEPLEEGTEEEEERLAKRRIRPRTAEDQQVIDLYRSEGFAGTFDDASRIIYGHQPASDPAPQPQAPYEQGPDPLDQVDGRTSAIQAEITQLEEQVNEAADNLETSEALNLQRQMMRKEMELNRLADYRHREVERRQTQAHEAHKGRAESSRDHALQAYPDLADRDSVFRKEFDHFVAERQRDPDYASVFESPKWPELMSNEFAQLKGVQVSQEQVPQQAHAPAMGTQARVLTSGSTAQPASAPVSPETFVQNLPKMTNDQLYGLLGEPDGRRVLR